MSKTNSWLCTYAIAQIGRPYWYATAGQISTVNLYTSLVQPQLKRLKYSLYSNYKSQLNVKVHDCSGLIVGALTCSGVNSAPSGKSPVSHGATLQFNGNCSTKSDSMKNFPKIPGTLVFVKKGDKKSHVGIYVGTYIDKKGKKHTGVVVEAMSHAYGVTTSSISNSKWGAWGQLSCCKKDTTVNTVFDARDNSVSGISGSTQFTIDSNNMKPFIATVLQGQNLKLDYGKIKAAKVSAMMFFAGELYNQSHIKKTYENPYLSDQVQQCNSAGLPYALYVNTRAKSVIEADEECRALYYVLAEYPPVLGVWVSLQINNSVEVNDKILEVYYKHIEQWGLKGRCGIYVTESQLAKITWNSFKDRFYLWMIADNVDVTTLGNKLLQPSLFEVPD